MSSVAKSDVPHDLALNDVTWSDGGQVARVRTYKPATELAKALEARGYTVMAATESAGNIYRFLYRSPAEDRNIRVLVRLDKPLPYEVTYRHRDAAAWTRFTAHGLSTWEARGEADLSAALCRRQYDKADVRVRPSLYFWR